MNNGMMWLKTILIFALLTPMFPLGYGHAAERTTPKTVDEVLHRINQDMRELYGYKGDYYPTSITMNGRTLSLRTDLIRKRLNQQPNQDGELDMRANTFEIVYGGDHGATLYHNGKELREYSGYSVNGQSVSSEGVPWFAGWSGTKIQNFNLIPRPWRDDDVRNKYHISKNRFDNYNDPSNKYLEDGTLEKSIQTGLDISFGNKKYKEFMYRNQNSQFQNRDVYDAGSKPKNGGKWINYVHVLQPPTELSWGFGTVYIDSSIGITYLDIPIAPFSLQNLTDLSASFEELPKSAVAGDQVRVGVKVNSTFVDPVTSDYSWTITRKSDGSSLTPQANQLEFTGHGAAESGSITLTKNASRVLYASFTMPDSDVRIQFRINEEGKKPEEVLLGNNTLDSDPIAVRVIRPVNLLYNVLSTQVKLPLNQGRPITATLTLPEPDGWWTSNATGALNVTNQTPDLFRDDRIEGNPPVNESSETITRYPVAHATVYRKDFGDDPVNRKWLNKEDPAKPIRRSGTFSYAGSVSRDYAYNYTTCDADGVCTTHTANDTTSADFNSGTDQGIYDVYVYNGRKELPKKTYLNKIENNDRNAKSKKMYWENEPYTYQVIRWMQHLNEVGETLKWEDVPGQYPRDFTQQASADIAWKSESTMAEQYQTARDAAKDKKNKKSLYDKAVFATDRQLQKYAYPIKSGYYFNPAGKYMFTVKTITYKPSPEDTKDHQDLVDTLIDSFRYESNLIYINNKKTAVNLTNQPLSAKGGGFKAVPGQLTADQPKGVNGTVMLKVLDRKAEESRYTKVAKEIYSSEQQDESQTHEFWKMVLEGYAESSTLGSKTNYQYREYVDKGQKKMYELTETTTVTIEINPDNLPVYTHANMQDGKYYVKAWIENAALNRGGHTYKKLGTLQGIDVLDQIEVTVVGSMFDDLND